MYASGRYWILKWCPGAESNHRHEDFQSGFKIAKSATCETKGCQTPDETPNTYTSFVKPCIGNPTKENAAPAGTGNGANDEKTRKNLQHQNTPKWRENSNHNRAVRVIEYALTSGTFGAWDGVAIVLAARLTSPERASLVCASLMTFEPEDAEQAFCAAPDQAGPPIAHLLSAMDEAAFRAVSRSTSPKLNRQGNAPAIESIGGIQRIRRKAIETWLAENEARATADAAHKAVEGAEPSHV